jgi:hypothetical protein
MFAYAETAAHLIYLVEKNYLRLIDDGEWKFSLGELAFEEVDNVSNLPLSLISH